MTPAAVAALVARALGRPGTHDEVTTWARVLEHFPDDAADQALLDHRATSTYPPTLADVRRHAIAILNDRAMRAETEARRIERETGRTTDGLPLVPMPATVRSLADQLAARQAARDAALQPDPPRDTNPGEGTRERATWPCCAHCHDEPPHPPHRAACELCPTPAEAST
mgnify:CR=1 FL=1